MFWYDISVVKIENVTREMACNKLKLKIATNLQTIYRIIV